jgi:hypothetical protein
MSIDDPRLVRKFHVMGESHLRFLCNLARAEEKAFFRRNTHLVELYQDRVVAVALCQGAALHYLDQHNGVKDFDIHFFYRQNPEHPRLSRTVYYIWVKVPDYGERRIDFVRTVIPTKHLEKPKNENPTALLQKFLLNAPTDNARHLAEKAVVGLYPDDLFGTIIWPISRSDQRG